MRLEELKNNWEQFGKSQPYGAVLATFEESDKDEFFAMGRQEIAELVALLQHVGWSPQGTALDFGSGLGRLSQALATHFVGVVGIDVAQSMVDKATALNTQGDRCRFIVNTKPDLSILESGSFDLIYTSLVLQHMAPKYEDSYIREFFRVIKPTGIVAFQVCEPVRAQTIKAHTPEWILRPYRSWHGKESAGMQMYGMSRRHVEGLVRSAGSRILHTAQRDSPGYPGHLYICAAPS